MYSQAIGNAPLRGPEARSSSSKTCSSCACLASETALDLERKALKPSGARKTPSPHWAPILKWVNALLNSFRSKPRISLQNCGRPHHSSQCSSAI